MLPAVYGPQYETMQRGLPDDPAALVVYVPGRVSPVLVFKKSVRYFSVIFDWFTTYGRITVGAGWDGAGPGRFGDG